MILFDIYSVIYCRVHTIILYQAFMGKTSKRNFIPITVLQKIILFIRINNNGKHTAEINKHSRLLRHMG